MELPEPGAHVTVQTTEGLTLTGRVLPSDHLVLKLDNGYNIGIFTESIKEVQHV